jgi:hypothetical protein
VLQSSLGKQPGLDLGNGGLIRGWTPWAKGPGDHDIEKIWWSARVLHFPKLNVSTYFDGSAHVGIEHWGYRGPQWTMRLPPADWQPMPPDYRQKAEQAWLRWHAATDGHQDARGADRAHHSRVIVRVSGYLSLFQLHDHHLATHPDGTWRWPDRHIGRCYGSGLNHCW